MKTIEIDDDSADNLVADILVQDYLNNLEALKSLKDQRKQFGLEDYQMEDYKAAKKRNKAYKVILQSYLLSEQLRDLGLE